MSPGGSVGKLWQELVEILGRRPLLWVPVLVADLLGYLLNLGRNGLLLAFVSHQTAQHSALSGAVIHAPMSTSAMEGATILALLLSWLTYFLRLLVFVGALVATAALIEAFLERVQSPISAVAPALARSWGAILELTLRALSVYAVFGLLFGWLRPYLASHGQQALLRNPWFEVGISALPPILLAVLLPPVAIRLLAGRQPGKEAATESRLFALTLVVVILLLAIFISSNSRDLAQISAGARYPLEIVASLVGALPYVLLFTGLALLARRTARAFD